MVRGCFFFLCFWSLRQRTFWWFAFPFVFLFWGVFVVGFFEQSSDDEDWQRVVVDVVDKLSFILHHAVPCLVRERVALCLSTLVETVSPSSTAAEIARTALGGDVDDTTAELFRDCPRPSAPNTSPTLRIALLKIATFYIDHVPNDIVARFSLPLSSQPTPENSVPPQPQKPPKPPSLCVSPSLFETQTPKLAHRRGRHVSPLQRRTGTHRLPPPR